MKLLLPLLAIVLLVLWLVKVAMSRYRKRSLIERIREEWGAPNPDLWNYELVGIYHDFRKKQHPEAAYLDERTWADLNGDELFVLLDRCRSSNGRQFLYHWLRQPQKDMAALQLLEDALSSMERQQEKRELAQAALSALGEKKAYYLPFLFLGERPVLPSWAPWAPVFPALSILFLLGAFLNPVFILCLIPLLVCNAGLHYWNKKTMRPYLDSFSSLSALLETARAVDKLDISFMDKTALEQSIKPLAQLSFSLKAIGSEENAASDPILNIGSLIGEYLKIIFLIEPVFFFSSLKRIEKHRQELDTLFSQIGYLDMAIAVVSFRQSLPYFCRPVFGSNPKELIAEDLYHPIVADCIPNSVDTQGRGMLITGSNMSGKTTFIRSLAVNAWLAQSMHTCCAKSYQGASYHILSSIAISDELTEGKSYFLAEVESILRLIQAADAGQPCMLIMDEVFKGTNTVERVAAAYALLAYLDKPNCLVLVSTHDIELNEMLHQQYRLYHFQEEVRDDELYFDHKLHQGPLKTRNALKILAISHYPAALIEQANAVLGRIEGK